MSVPRTYLAACQIDQRSSSRQELTVRESFRGQPLMSSLINMLPELFVKYVQWLVPTVVLRFGIRWWMVYVGYVTRSGDVVVQQIKCDRQDRINRPVTTQVEVTNEQLYANDPAFFLMHLGPKLKYSACEWPEGVSTLGEAETFTIGKYQEKAGIASLPAGSRVLELGCGWGSLSLSNAERFPHLNFVGFSNSPPQIEFIKARAKERNITNLNVYVEDYADFADLKRSKVAPAGAPLFDLAFAIETVEHAQNIGELLGAAAARLKPGAKFFVHSLLHQSCSYLLSSDTWMGRNFYTGGSILSLNSYLHLAPPSLRVVDVQPVSGTGYMKTSLAWLERQEAHRKEFVTKYGSEFYEGFRMFYIAVAEAFGANSGNEFMCGYYTFERTTL